MAGAKPKKVAVYTVKPRRLIKTGAREVERKKYEGGHDYLLACTRECRWQATVQGIQTITIPSNVLASLSYFILRVCLLFYCVEEKSQWRKRL